MLALSCRLVVFARSPLNGLREDLTEVWILVSLVVVPKRFVGLSGTCVDIRGWKWADAVAHHDVSRALIRAGYSDMLPAPPPEPTVLERATDKARQLRDEVVQASSNAWQRAKAKAAEWKAAAGRQKSEVGNQKSEARSQKTE